jgi:glycosyltransferase involved in cell wall biosynthesis
VPTRVVVLRGHQANPWELRPWELLDDRFDVRFLRSARNWFDADQIALPSDEVRTLRALLPKGKLGDLAARVPGDRYLGLEEHLRGADIVHSQELGYWYSAQAAALSAKLGFRLVLTVWETLPFRDTYRNVRTRAYRRRVLEATDLFLAASERARDALLLEGANPDRIQVAAPGVDLDRFSASGSAPPGPPVILSPGRLVWEKGHQDVLRAVALLRHQGALPPGTRVVIVGSGPERGRLEGYAAELGIGGAVELREFVPYEQMPDLYGQAACMVLASLPVWSWEEQLGMVLIEAMASGVPVLASTSGAIPEVMASAAQPFSPGDWVGLAALLRDAIAQPAPHVVADAERVERFSAAAAAARLAEAYEAVLNPS